MQSTPTPLAQALQCHQTGNLAQAEQLYRQILQAEPQHCDALHLLGVIGLQTGRTDLAIECISQAVRVKPDFAQAYANLGVAYQAAGKMAEAVASYRQAVRLKPDEAPMHNNLGNALRMQGKLDEALASLREAMRLRPNFAEAHNNLGNTLQEQGKPAEAQASYQQALRLKPDYAEAHCNLGTLLQEQRKLDEAAVCYRQALRCNPNSVQALNSLGNNLRMQGQFADAEASCRQALRLKPDYAEAHNNLGSVLVDQGKTEEALASYRQALRYKPDHAGAFTNIGNVLLGEKKLADAAGSYEQALRLAPNQAEAHCGRALVWLAQGDYQRGWAEYEWRWRRTEQPPRPFTPPRWQGEFLVGRPGGQATLLLYAEQGLGDTLQFVRYASLAKARSGATVLLECPSALVRLLRRCTGIDQVVPSGEPLPVFDAHVPLLSLPGLLGTTSIDRIPAAVPYIAGDAELEQRWRARLQSIPGFRVGIVWQGSPANKGDHRRSAPLQAFAALAEIAGVKLISLQKGPGSEQLSKLSGLVVDLGPELTDFADTAAVLKNLNLVVTVDTALAHLAGALGVAGWVALPFAADWRWLPDGEVTPWYPSLRLCRQSRAGDWDEVFGRFKQALRDRVGAMPAR